MKKQEKIDAFKKLRELTKARVKKREWGLCTILWTNRFADGHYVYLKDKIDKVPRMKDKDGSKPAYCWKPGVKAPRIKWINEQIKKLGGKK